MEKKYLITVLFIFFLLNSSMVSAAETYDETGSISDNGDEYWDSNELDFIKYSLKANEEFTVDVFADGDIEVFLCDCSSKDEVTDIINSLVYEIVPDNLYMWLDSYSFTTGSYTPNRDIKLNLAIFTISDYGLIEYTISTNVPSGSGINWFVVLLVIAGIGFLVYYFNNKGKKDNKIYGQYNTTNQPGFYTPPVNTYQPTLSQPEVMQPRYCANCGEKGTTKFCMNCGEKLEL